MEKRLTLPRPPNNLPNHTEQHIKPKTTLTCGKSGGHRVSEDSTVAGTRSGSGGWCWVRLRGGRLAGPSRCRAPAALKAPWKTNWMLFSLFPQKLKSSLDFLQLAKQVLVLVFSIIKVRRQRQTFETRGKPISWCRLAPSTFGFQVRVQKPKAGIKASDTVLSPTPELPSLVFADWDNNEGAKDGNGGEMNLDCTLVCQVQTRARVTFTKTLLGRYGYLYFIGEENIAQRNQECSPVSHS